MNARAFALRILDKPPVGYGVPMPAPDHIPGYYTRHVGTSPHTVSEPQARTPMRNFIQIGTTDVLPLLLQLDAHPALWDQHQSRTNYEGSPHVGVPDIWLRWARPEHLTSRQAFNDPIAEFQWYPAMAELPAARSMLMDIMQRVGGLALGGVFITRIPPGGSVKPHSDKIGWHARYYHRKVYVSLKSNPNCINYCNDEPLVMAPGSVWSFDNCQMHSVINEGADDRITMMAAIRCD